MIFSESLFLQLSFSIRQFPVNLFTMWWKYIKFVKPVAIFRGKLVFDSFVTMQRYSR